MCSTSGAGSGKGASEDGLVRSEEPDPKGGFFLGGRASDGGSMVGGKHVSARGSLRRGFPVPVAEMLAVRDLFGQAFLDAECEHSHCEESGRRRGSNGRDKGMALSVIENKHDLYMLPGSGGTGPGVVLAERESTTHPRMREDILAEGRSLVRDGVTNIRRLRRTERWTMSRRISRNC